MPAENIASFKQCRKCRQSFPATTEFFHVDRGSRNTNLQRLSFQCKACRNGGWEKECLYCHEQIQRISYYVDGVRIRPGRMKAYCSHRCKILHKVGGIGAKHGRLTIVDYAGVKVSGKDTKSLVSCLCECGEESIVEHSNILSGGTKSCGCMRRERPKGDKAANWKGGRRMISNGYMVLHAPDHPNAMSDGYVLEHVFVMSQFLGRPLRKGEEVHHLDGRRDQNNIGNLELWTKSQPAGQRVEDMVAFCEAYLQQYRADARKLASRNTSNDSSQLSFLVPGVGEIPLGPSEKGEVL